MRRRFPSPIQSSAWAQTLKVPPHDEWSKWWFLLELGTDQHAVCRQTHRAGLGRLFGRSALWREILQCVESSGGNPSICTATVQYQACRPLLFSWGHESALHGNLTSSAGQRTLESKQTTWFGAYSTHQESYSIPVKDKLSDVFSSPFSKITCAGKKTHPWPSTVSIL